MKKIYILFLVFLSHNLFAQGSSKTTLLITAHLEGKVGYTQGTSFQKFVTSYNLQNPLNETKLRNFRATAGYSFGCDVIYGMGIMMGYYQHYTSAMATSKINTYTTREFKLQQNTIGMDFGYGTITKNGGGGIYFGIYVANANIIAAMKYRDGYRSIGTDAGLNGIYNAFTLASCVGGKIYRFKGPVGFTAAMRWCPIFGNVAFNDQVYDKSLPEDLVAYQVVGGWPYYKGNDVLSRFQSIYLDFGIAFKLYNL
ncbi:MAG: hypothetical protein NTW54_01030 [Bacteroidetes bacterium]|nr:hypothetical protein [Bacteroidota bacterium]